QRAQASSGNDAAKRARLRIDHAGIAAHETSHRRAHSVGAHHDVDVALDAIAELQADARRGFRETYEAVPKVDCSSESLAQGFLQIGAMDAEVRCAVSLLVTCADADVMTRDSRPGPTVAMDQLGRLGRCRANVVE